MNKATWAMCLLPAVIACGTAASLAAQAKAQPPSGGVPLYMKMTDKDVELADRTVQIALESNPSDSPANWYNRKTGNRGSVTPLRTYRAKSGHFCRRYRESVTVNARTEIYRDTACRNGQGTWIPLVSPNL